MAKITKMEIKRIYALGAAIGAVERGNKDDNLHALVYTMTGKDSVSELTDSEFKRVERELMSRMQLQHHNEPLKSKKKEAPAATPGMITSRQQGLAWRYIYRLSELDKEESAATVGERMAGAIRKILCIEARIADPFRWVTADQAEKLIEQLKRYVRSAERAQRKAANA